MLRRPYWFAPGLVGVLMLNAKTACARCQVTHLAVPHLALGLVRFSEPHVSYFPCDQSTPVRVRKKLLHAYTAGDTLTLQRCLTIVDHPTPTANVHVHAGQTKQEQTQAHLSSAPAWAMGAAGTRPLFWYTQACLLQKCKLPPLCACLAPLVAHLPRLCEVLPWDLTTIAAALHL